MERMVNRRLVHYLESNDLLDHRQHAFRPGHGTGTYFATLGDVLHEAKVAEQHIELATLDLVKAYNRAWTPGVLEQLAEWKLAGHVLHFIKNFLRNRTFQVCIGNSRSRRFAEETGVPQGSVIAVTLFLVAMNGIFRNLPKEIYIFVYADDILLVVVGCTMKALRRRLQAAVSAVSRWSESVGFSISAEKCSITHICDSNHRPLQSQVNINGVLVPYRKTVRVLGIRLDRRLSFAEHFKDVKENCKTRLNILRSIARRHQHNNRSVRSRVAKAIVDSRLTYGIEITCASIDLLITNLGTIYHQAIRITSGLLPSTPGIAACIEAGRLSFDRFVAETISKRAVSFVEKTSPARGRVFLLEEANRLLSFHTNQVLPPVAEVHWCGARDWISPRVRIDLAIKNNFRAGTNSPALARSVAELQHTKYANHHIRFSDGSRATGQVGIGVADPLKSSFYRLPDPCSVFSAEAAAAFVAATSPADKPIAVFTDSASVISALSSDTAKHPWIQGIQKHANDTVFIWIPGHCGIHGNIEADHLAATGRQGTFLTREVPAQDLKHWISTSIRCSWATYWLQRRTPFIRKIKGEINMWEDPPNHQLQRVLSWLRTGHTRVSHNMVDSGPFRRICQLCSVNNSVEHIICNCPLYQGVRSMYGISVSIRNALGNDPSSVAALTGFLKDTGLFDQI